MDLGLSDKVAIVTGGSAGIGYAAARALASEGARVVICARTGSKLTNAARTLQKETHGDVIAVAGDVSREEHVRALLEATIQRFGRLDILVNNAGTSKAAPFTIVDDAVWQEDLDLKLFAAIRATRLAVPHMRAVGGGAIVNVVNIAAKAPRASSLPTSVTRAAGLALTKATSRDLAIYNIRVNAVCIGVIKSDQHLRRAEATHRLSDLESYYAELAQERAVPLGRVGEAEEAGDLITFLVSDRARYITGAAVNLDGGASPVA